MDHKLIIEQFYDSFKSGDAAAMIACYADEVIFTDPAFGQLKGDRAKAMWTFLLSRSESQVQIEYENVSIDQEKQSGSAQWTARYAYGSKKRPVVNHVQASFEFQDQKIIKHTDDFNLWTWSKQALGLPGLLLGWSPYMKNKIQSSTHYQLNKFMAKQATL